MPVPRTGSVRLKNPYFVGGSTSAEQESCVTRRLTLLKACRPPSRRLPITTIAAPVFLTAERITGTALPGTISDSQAAAADSARNWLWTRCGCIRDSGPSACTSVTGNCFGCDNCYGVCPDNAVLKVDEADGYAFDLDFCKGCGICVAECPCGAIEMIPEAG